MVLKPCRRESVGSFSEYPHDGAATEVPIAVASGGGAIFPKRSRRSRIQPVLEGKNRVPVMI
jgi:hypothetical protein